MKTVQQLLQVKGSGVVSVTPDTNVFDALKVMAEREVGAVLVLDAGCLVGIMSERDYARKVVLKGRSSQEMLVREIMTPRLICARPQQTVAECMQLMTEHRVRHLPVLDGARLAGILSIGDLVKETISEQEQIIHQLETYIHG